MTISLKSIPSFPPAEALAAANRNYALKGSVSTLPSERDQNFLIADSHGGKFILKIANSSDSPALLDFQNQAMRHVEKSDTGCRVPQIIRSPQGLDITSMHDARTGADHCVRLLTWIDGEVLAKSTPRDALLFESIGAAMARIDAALGDFSHPSMRRVLQWDLRRAGMARQTAWLLPPERRARVERLFSQWEEVDWTGLRHTVIHGDANDYNVIVADGRMVGLLDFGDIVHTATVCDLAIALAYTMLGEPEPLAAAAHVIRAYQRQNPLKDGEQRALFPLILSRLCMSVCYSAHNRERSPHDSYQVVSEDAAWDLLDKLERWSATDALTLIRAACAPHDDAIQ
ncbi:MAG TPA: phosphotransferase [Steroidobacteraceae bacterium]|nr:phosphotransferase [Steroidobacteraceae bacterium]